MHLLGVAGVTFASKCSLFLAAVVQPVITKGAWPPRELDAYHTQVQRLPRLPAQQAIWSHLMAGDHKAGRRRRFTGLE